MWNFHIIWGMILIVIIVLWILSTTQPYFRDRVDGLKESFDRWWAIDNDIKQPHLKDRHFRDMVDNSKTQRNTTVVLTSNLLPKGSKRHTQDANCYIDKHGREYCVH